MKSYAIKHARTIRRIIAFSLFGLAAALPRGAFAVSLGSWFMSDIGLPVVGKFSGFIIMVFGWIASRIFSLGGGLVQFGIDLNSRVLEGVMVREGFKISLAVTNLGFVLAIIIIAFATILRLESYGMKRMLSKLIMAAFLINFSLAVAGAFLDFTGVLSNYFINQATNSNPAMWEETIAGAFGIEGSLKAREENFDKDVTEDLHAMLIYIGSMIFTVFFTLVAAMVFLGIGLMVLIRYVMLVFLLVLMPLAWLGLVIPGIHSWWSKWWGSFLKWVFFLPACIFFIHLAILSFHVTKGEVEQQLSQFSAEDSFFTGSIPLFVNMIVSIAFLYGALIAAQQLGIKGASGTMAFAKGMRTAIIGKPKGAGGWGKWAGEKMAAGTTSTLARVPVARRLLAPLSKNLREKTATVKTARQEARAERAGERMEKGTDAWAKKWQEAGPEKKRDLLLDMQKAAGSRWLGAIPYWGTKRKAGAIRALTQLSGGEGLATRKQREKAGRNAAELRERAFIPITAPPTTREEEALESIFDPRTGLQTGTKTVTRKVTVPGISYGEITDPEALKNMKQQKEWLAAQKKRQEGGVKEKKKQEGGESKKIKDLEEKLEEMEAKVKKLDKA